MIKSCFRSEKAGRLIAANREKWARAQEWVDANPDLVRQIAAPYRDYMSAEPSDLTQEAYIAAFEAARALERLGKRGDERYGAFFRVCFRNRCILAASVGKVAFFDIDPDQLVDWNSSAAESAEPRMEESSGKIIEASLCRLRSRRRREVCRWVLSQANPVTTSDIARHFGIGERYARQLITLSKPRLELSASTGGV